MEKEKSRNKCYRVERKPAFLVQGSEVSKWWLERIFTDKAIQNMVEDGFLREIVNKDKEWLDFLNRQIESSADTFRNKLISEVLTYKDKGTKVMLYELKEDQLEQVVGEFNHVKRLGNKIALHVEVPENRELEVHKFFGKIVSTFTDYQLLSENNLPKRGWIYDTGSELFITEIVKETLSNCLIITEYK